MAIFPATDYKHPQEAIQRPDVGVQDHFSTKKPTKAYRYDSSLDPTLSWDESRERNLAEWLLGLVQRCATEGEGAVFTKPQIWAGGGVQVQSLKAAADLLQALSQPFLNWTGKAERHQISVPTVPLFVHERHSTKAILEGIKHRKAKGTTFDLFGDGGGLDVTDKLDAYEHKGPWQNRMILGDSLQVMNSLLEFEGLGGQVQMIYMDPPYGVKFGSNFQPFVRKRDVKPAGDEDMTREPEMVKAYRDTWELGLHSYLTYLRDRLLTARELLNESGSVFVQISDENLHHVREVMDEVFGATNFVACINFKTMMPLESGNIESVVDYICWYAREKSRMKYNNLYVRKNVGVGSEFVFADADNEEGYRRLSKQEIVSFTETASKHRIFKRSDLTSSGYTASCTFPIMFNGKTFQTNRGKSWRTTAAGVRKLEEKNRLFVLGSKLYYKMYLNDFGFTSLINQWTDTIESGGRLYVVQTTSTVIQRCILMVTDPGDIVFDPTCGAGTTAFVAEKWGRRWLTCDTSRVPLALARQRLLTAAFPYYELKDPQAGPMGGFIYKRKQNRNGGEAGGLVPHITLESIVNEEQPSMEVLVDRPEVNDKVTRVAGPFVLEATIAPAQVVDVDSLQAPVPSQGSSPSVSEADAVSGILPLTAVQSGARYADPASHIERMTQVLRQSKTLRLPGNRELVLADIRRMADSDVLHAEGVDTEGKPIAVVFGPEDGAISSDVVFEAAREAYFLKFPQLYFFGFAIQAKARELLEDRAKVRVPCTYVTVTPDVVMSDLLKTSRASQIFSVTGLPDAVVRRAGKKNDEDTDLYEVELKGLDIFNPATMEQEDIAGHNVPAWMLDIDYDGMCFYAAQVFFPKTAAWDNLQKALKADFDPSVWEHLAGTISEPFPIGLRRRVAVKVIDERGNELMRVLEVKA